MPPSGRRGRRRAGRAGRGGGAARRGSGRVRARALATPRRPDRARRVGSGPRGDRPLARRQLRAAAQGSGPAAGRRSGCRVRSHARPGRGRRRHGRSAVRTGATARRGDPGLGRAGRSASAAGTKRSWRTGEATHPGLPARTSWPQPGSRSASSSRRWPSARRSTSTCATCTSSGSTGPVYGSSTTSSSCASRADGHIFRNLFAPEIEARSRPTSSFSRSAACRSAPSQPSSGPEACGSKQAGDCQQPAFARGGDPRGDARGACSQRAVSLRRCQPKPVGAGPVRPPRSLATSSRRPLRGSDRAAGRTILRAGQVRPLHVVNVASSAATTMKRDL